MTYHVTVSKGTNVSVTLSLEPEGLTVSVLRNKDGSLMVAVTDDASNSHFDITNTPMER